MWLRWLVRGGAFHLRAPVLPCAGASRWLHGIPGGEFSAASAACFRSLLLQSCSPSRGKLFCMVGNVPHQIGHRFQIPIRVGHSAMTKVGR